jgi:hypothetical protein
VTPRNSQARLSPAAGLDAACLVVAGASTEGEPIHGFVDDGNGASSELIGWLGLMSVLARLRVGTTDDRGAT